MKHLAKHSLTHLLHSCLTCCDFFFQLRPRTHGFLSQISIVTQMADPTFNPADSSHSTRPKIKQHTSTPPHLPTPDPPTQRARLHNFRKFHYIPHNPHYPVFLHRWLFIALLPVREGWGRGVLTCPKTHFPRKNGSTATSDAQVPCLAPAKPTTNVKGR